MTGRLYIVGNELYVHIVILTIKSSDRRTLIIAVHSAMHGVAVRLRGLWLDEGVGWS